MSDGRGDARGLHKAEQPEPLRTNQVLSERAGRQWRAIPVLGLALLLAAMVVVRYYPFEWDPPRWVDNDVTRSAGGALQFGDHNFAKTEATPSWLGSAREDGLTVVLEVKPDAVAAEGPPPVMMLARDYWNNDFAVHQDGSGVLIWLRRPGSNESGSPPFFAPDAFAAGQWTTLRISIDERLEVSVDGRERLTEPLPPDARKDWDGGLLVLGDEVRGGGPWRGEIRRAEVVTSEGTIDYVSPGALSIPASYFHAPEHVAPFPPRGRLEWTIFVGHLISFAALAFLLMFSRRPGPRPAVAWSATVGVAVVLGAGKFLFQGRHVSIGDLLAAAAGAAIGIAIARVLASRRRRPVSAAA